jgi:MoaA/NifB/PqqE/SkfB family radical SAM enzyme
MHDIHKEDISIDYFTEICKTLPFKVIFRFLGGEPTLHPNILELLQIARQYHHIPTIASNGKKYLDKSFVKELKKIRGCFYGITMNGGISNNEAYNIIDNEDCLEWKNMALQNLLDYKINTINLSAMLMRNVNENVVPEFIKLAENNKNYIRFLKFRPASKLGRYIETDSYTTNDFINIFKNNYFKNSKTIYTTNDPELQSICEKNKCCHYFIYDNFLTVSFSEFISDGSKNCWKRGYLNDFELTKLFSTIAKTNKKKEIGAL